MASKIATIRNLKYIASDYTDYLTALSIMDTYGTTSVFDAIYAVTTSSANVPDHTIISTEKKYDTIRALTGIDPREAEV